LCRRSKRLTLNDERYGQGDGADQGRELVGCSLRTQTWRALGRVLNMEVPETFYPLVENTCRELYIRSLKEIPPDVVAAIKKAAATETKEVAKRIFSHYIQSIELGQTKD